MRGLNNYEFFFPIESWLTSNVVMLILFQKVVLAKLQEEISLSDEMMKKVDELLVCLGNGETVSCCYKTAYC